MDTRQRILAAVQTCATDTGLRKLSMDEIARAAGMGRATLYKYFPGRDALIQAWVTDELTQFFDTARETIGQYPDADDRLIHGFALGYRMLANHPSIGAVRRVNPELLLPFVITDDSTPLNLGRALVESLIPTTEMADSATRAKFAEHVARAFHTLILIPSTVLDLDAPDGPEQYARDFLIPIKIHLTDRL